MTTWTEMYRIYIPLRSIRRMYQAGMTVRELATRYFVSYYAMRSRLEDIGVLRAKRKLRIGSDDLRWKYQTERRSLHALAKHYKVALQTLKWYLEKYDIPRRQRGCPSKEYVCKSILFLASKGMKPKAIAARCNTSIRYVYRKLEDPNEKSEMR